MKSRLPVLLVAALLVVGAGCSGRKKAAPPATTAATADSLFAGAAGPVDFAVARETIRRLYAHHPEIRTFVYRDVFYTPETRDKVLTVCRRGSLLRSWGVR